MFRNVIFLKRMCTGLLYIWGVTYMAITVLIAVFKSEKDHRPEDGHVKLDVVENYALLWDILKMPKIRILAMALLTVKVKEFKILTIAIMI